jgi:hypothetical protein
MPGILPALHGTQNEKPSGETKSPEDSSYFVPPSLRITVNFARSSGSFLSLRLSLATIRLKNSLAE